LGECVTAPSGLALPPLPVPCHAAPSLCLPGLHTCFDHACMLGPCLAHASMLDPRLNPYLDPHLDGASTLDLIPASHTCIKTAPCRLHHTEAQLRDVHRRLSVAEKRLQVCVRESVFDLVPEAP